MTRARASSRPPALNALQLLTSSRWAMRREALEQMLAAAERDLPAMLAAGLDVSVAESEDGAPAPARRRALFAAPATAHPKSERVGVRDGVAIVPIVGPLCRYASWIQEVCGLTSYQLAAFDFQVALEDPSIRAVMLHLDTPGGEVNGCAELAQLIHGSRGRKPIVAMVSDGAASAGYWLAAACDEIVVSPSAYVGSIGVWFEIVDYTAAEQAEGVRRFRIVSSQSPNKVPDPADDAGRAVLQREVDQFADAFLEAVAAFRGTTAAELITRGDGGAVFIGRHAVTQRLADRVSTTEAVLTELATRSAAAPSAAAPPAAPADARRSSLPLESAMSKKPAASTATPPAPPTPAAAAPRALAAGDEITCKVSREVAFTEGAKATVVEVRENVTALAVKEGDEEKRWLLADEVDVPEGVTTAPADDTPADEDPEALRTKHPKAAAAILAAGAASGAAAERARIEGILSLPGSAAHPAVVRACIADPACTRADAAEKLLASKPAFSNHLQAFFAAEHGSPAPAPSNGAGAGEPEAADRIIAAHRLVRGVTS